MKDYTKVREIIETYISTNFTEVEVQFQNLPLSTKSPEEYINVSDDEIDAEVWTGLIIISIHTKRNNGTERSRYIAEQLSSLLDNKDLDGIVFNEGVLRSLEDDESPYFTQQLFIEYYREGESSC
jgi:hypothetical protein